MPHKLPPTVLSQSPSVRDLSPISLSHTTHPELDDVDTILARFNDAGQFDELETVWFLIALVYSVMHYESNIY